MNVDLVALDMLGFDLSQNPYALNETFIIIIRTALPFIALIIVALLTKPDEKGKLDRFYAKMRTPVLPDHEADALAVEQACRNVSQTQNRLIFPKSSWEFKKWTKTDFKGEIWVILGCISIFVLIYLIATIGG